MAERGGEPPALRTMISAGPEVWCRTHGTAGRRPVERGDIMYFDTAGVVDRYHADLCRTISIGVDHPRVREIMDVTRGSVDAVSRPSSPATRSTSPSAWRRTTCSRASTARTCGGSAATRWASRCRPTGSGTPTFQRRVRAVHVGARLRHELREHPLRPRRAFHGVVHGDAADDRDRHRGALPGRTVACIVATLRIGSERVRVPDHLLARPAVPGHRPRRRRRSRRSSCRRGSPRRSTRSRWTRA